MKLISYIFTALCLLSLSGCEQSQTQEEKDAKAATCMSTINYKEHSYVTYTVATYGGARVVSITHDPDCKCHQSTSNESHNNDAETLY